MPFSPSDLELLNESREVRIVTRAGGRTYRTIIWIVVDGGEVFVRSVRGTRGKWYQRAVENPEVLLEVGSSKLDAHAVLAADPVSVERTSEALRRKYRGRSLEAMLVPETLETTMRLEASPK